MPSVTILVNNCELKLKILGEDGLYSLVSEFSVLLKDLFLSFFLSWVGSPKGYFFI